MIANYLFRQSYALEGLDLKLHDYLRFRNGFFVEAGANNGIRQSNTLYFEKYLGWKGLLIEAIPELAEQCRLNRPKCYVENCALVSADYPAGSIEVQYCNLMSVVKGGMRSEAEEQQHLQSGLRFLQPDEQVYTVTVPARTLSDILASLGSPNIDLLSLDVEGYEAQVLKGLDLTRHKPKYMVLEARYKEDIEDVIGSHYTELAVLNESRADTLYQLR